ncbi:fimbria/pilus outer membrane usher protein [uncultured Castellaniella sp.]|uniref:fimbria/pilus outer membrane usher protein n=1 Tax=uncultured Castellaniella sp. TaxID=647907 RepID=UPI0026109D44|nr:fimbria/pilus outer membrane usher protein [uncultured Castellaniella sp.]
MRQGAGCLCGVLVVWVLAADAAMAQGAPDGLVPTRLGLAGAQDVYLLVTLNGRPAGSVTHFVLQGERLLAAPADLRALGLNIPPGSGAAPRALDGIPGLRYTYHAGRQSVDIRAPGSLLLPYQYGVAPATSLPSTAGRGLVLNYDAYYQYFDTDQLSLWQDLRYFSPAGVLESTGAAYWDPQGERYVRFDTSWTRSDPDTLRTLVVGDAISGGLDWTRSVRLGGLQWSRNFSLRPDLVTFPVPVFTGSATVPSTVDLYVNSVRQLSTQVPGGPFMLAEMPGITGGGNATIVTRDALGRTVTVSMPLYIDQRMLAPGLSAYSVEAGFLRQRYGFDSWSYDSSPAASGTYRRGLSDALTLEAHAEATRGLYEAGVGGLVRLGSKGVVNAAVAGSSGRGSGAQLALGYQWIQPEFSLDLQTIRQFREYRDLGAASGAPAPRRTDRATLSLPLGRSGTMAFSYIHYQMAGEPASRIGSAAYNLALNSHASLNLSAYQDFGASRERGVMLGVSIALDDKVSLSAYAGRQNGETSLNASAIRTPDYAGGWGWGLQSGRNAMLRWNQAQARYLGRYGELTAQAQEVDGRGGFSLEAAGAAVLMDGDLQWSRRIDDSFAMVSTDGVSDVPVLHENRVIGVTNGSGHFLVPDLNPYQRNQIAVDGLNLPADTRVEDPSRVVVPRDRSGVLVRFPLRTYRAATVVLDGPDGKPLPVGSLVRHEETGESTIVGYGGEAFVKRLSAVNHLRVESDGGVCSVRFDYRGNPGGRIPTIGPLSCVPEGEATP